MVGSNIIDLTLTTAKSASHEYLNIQVHKMLHAKTKSNIENGDVQPIIKYCMCTPRK